MVAQRLRSLRYIYALHDADGTVRRYQRAPGGAQHIASEGVRCDMAEPSFSLLPSATTGYDIADYRDIDLM